MTKLELDKRARLILDSETPRSLRNNMVLVSTEDLSRILGLTLREVQKRYGHWDIYALEVVGRSTNGYWLRFPGGQEIEMGWVKNEK